MFGPLLWSRNRKEPHHFGEETHRNAALAPTVNSKLYVQQRMDYQI
jgi:hypothetical protein